MLTKSGPKLLDFGLAKWTTGSEEALAAMPTRADVTAKGTMLGTLQYMAPEQIEGREADARTDIFAFGALLYEMVTGRKAFEGKSQATLISAIMSRDPKPLSLLAPLSPPALEHIVERCLAKDADSRWQSAHSLLVQVRWVAYGDSRTKVDAAESSADVRRRRIAVAVLAVATLAVTAFAVPAYLHYRGPAPPEPISYRMPVRGLTHLAIAPDGRGIAFVAEFSGGSPTLFYRAINSLTAVRLEGTTNAEQPFFSPDSEHIAFVAGGSLRRIPISGGTARPLGSVAEFRGGAWSQSGAILYGSSKGLFRISDQGGAAEQVTTVEAPSTGHLWPEFLPDGVGYLFHSSSSESGERALFAGALGTTERTKLLAIDSKVRYAEPGYLLFMQERAVVAQRFDPPSRALSAEPRQLVADVRRDDFGGTFDVSNSGVLAYFDPRGIGGRGRGTENPQGQFSWVTRRGGQYVRPVGEPGPWGDIDLSPNGDFLAMTRLDAGSADVWILDWRRGPTAISRLTLDPANDQNPVWSHDGKRVAFTTYRRGNADIYIKNANNVGAEEPLLATDGHEAIEDWARDGSHIVYLTGEETRPDIWAMPLAGERKAFPVVVGPFLKDEPQFSRDGRWLAYSTNESGDWEVYVTSFPDLKQREKASVGGGVQPRWSPDGKTLYYRSTGGRTWAVQVRASPQLGVGTPEHLFDRNYQPGYTNAPVRHQWAVSPDGEQFLLRAGHQAPRDGSGVVSATMSYTPPGAAGGTAPPTTNAPAGGLTILLNWPQAIRKDPR
jgi:Tol biopolymer transport system component